MKPIQSIIRILFALSATLLMQACTREDLSVCEAKLVIDFRYNDGTTTTTTTDVFPEEVKAITLFLFDANGLFAGEYQSLRNPAQNTHSVRTMLPDGRYDLIAWGGARDNYDLTPLTVGVTRLADAVLSIRKDAQGNLERHNEPIYYGASFSFDKTSGQTAGQHQTIEMVRKTYFIRLTVEGLPYSTPPATDDTRATQQEAEFVGRITSPGSNTNFDNSLAGNKQLVYIPHHDVANQRLTSDFVIMYYPDLWESHLRVEYHPQGSLGTQQLFDENLRNLLLQNPDVDLEHDTAFDVNIRIDDFTTGAVTITINGWTLTNGGGGIIG